MTTTAHHRTAADRLARVAATARTIGHVERADALDHLAKLADRPTLADRLAAAGVDTTAAHRRTVA